MKVIFIILVIMQVTTLPAFSAGSMSIGYLMQKWKHGSYGFEIGKSGISVYDIDNDGISEIIFGSRKGNNVNPYLSVVKMDGTGSYEQIWFSDPYPERTKIKQLKVDDIDGDKIGDIVISLDDGTIDIFNGLSLEKTGSFNAGTDFSSFEIADIDQDGAYELLTTSGTFNRPAKLNVYSASSFELLWELSFSESGSYIKTGNIDDDTALEIVMGNGTVIDGITREVEQSNLKLGWYDIGNIDEDKREEIISSHGIYDDDASMWKQYFNFRDIDAFYVGDIDSDGIDDIIKGDNQWGSIFSAHLSNSSYWSILNPLWGVYDIAAGDVDNDGDIEVIWSAGAGTGGPDQFLIADPGTKVIEWKSNSIDSSFRAFDIGDIDNDGKEEVVLGGTDDDNGVIRIFNANTHQLEWETTALPNIEMWKGLRSLRVGDVDDDGESEFVISTSDNSRGLIQVYDGKTHTLETESAKHSGAYFTAIEIIDVDNDGATEIVAGLDGPYIVALNGSNAVEKWRSPRLSSYGYIHDLEIADLNADGNLEIIAACGIGGVYVFDVASKSIVWSSNVSSHAVYLFDIENDGSKEILLGLDDGSVAVHNSSDYALIGTYPTGTETIYGLYADDLNTDGHNEWIIFDRYDLTIIDQETKEILWKLPNTGGFLVNYNQIHTFDKNNDGIKEVLMGSDLALFEFNISPMPYNQSPDLGKVPVNYSSDPIQMTLYNPTDRDLHISTLDFIGPDASSFYIDPYTCQSLTPQIPPKGKCDISIIFSPNSPGDKTAYLSVAGDNTSVTFQTVELTGRGLADNDGDGIANDGDDSGIEGDNPCIGGIILNCDDNCISEYNPDQKDWDSNGTGDVCDLYPHHPCDFGEPYCVFDDFELLDAIDLWSNEGTCGDRTIDDFELLDLINYWAAGIYC